MTKIEFLMKALENNGGSMNFFDDCSICPLREMCRAEAEKEDATNYTTCGEFLNRVLKD